MTFPSTPVLAAGIIADGPRQPLTDPAHGTVFHEAATVSAGRIDACVRAARTAFEKDWRDVTPSQRAALLHKLADLIERNAEVIGEAETRSMGKPISASIGEAKGGAGCFRYYAGAIAHLSGETIPVSRGGLDITLRQPLGVVACIVPWNFPFAIACWKVAPALAAGNCVLLKPASLSPLGAMVLGELAREAGIPDGVLQVLPGAGSALGDALVTHPLVRKVSFTGSTEIGSHVMKLAAADLTRVSLELGGKSPNIVFSDADLEKAADSAPWSVFDNTGQDCCARSRILVQRPADRDFAERFTAAMAAMKVGDPMDPATELGPLVTARQRDISEDYIARARAAGRTVHGGSRPGGAGWFLNPALILDCAAEDAWWNDEIFGPVASLRAFDDEATAIGEANDTPYGLSGSIWTRDLQRAVRVSRQVEAGVISINCHNSVHTEAPFGGFKQSGLGRDLGMASLHGYTELKNIYFAP
ncbi:MAG: Betaine-aldehyde dehydrogenase [Verrucomicrobiales bacterium]|nr:Betaine-aldehyde dehydrogenase [Verrucomicrobiales bacterium]